MTGSLRTILELRDGDKIVEFSSTVQFIDNEGRKIAELPKPYDPMSADEWRAAFYEHLTGRIPDHHRKQ